LHKYFDWDNSVAGEKWRLQQARNLVNHIIEVTMYNGEEVEMKAFFPVFTENNENEYVYYNPDTNTSVIKRPNDGEQNYSINDSGARMP
jgi:hypothetical protein